MIVKHIIGQVDWEAFEKRHPELYPNEADMTDGYLIAIARLLKTEPIKTEEPRYLTLVTNSELGIEIIGINKERTETYALTLTPESEILGMEIDPEIVGKFSVLDIAIHILFEICFHGFEGTEKGEVLKKLTGALKDIENDDMFVTHNGVKVHRSAVDALGMIGSDFTEFIDEFKEQVKLKEGDQE